MDGLRDATGSCAANIYQFACGSVAYFAPDAPDFQEAGELSGAVWAVMGGVGGNGSDIDVQDLGR